VFALSSIITPFALGTVIGGIASGRVPVGNAKGDLVTSWLNPTAILIGALFVVFSAYLAAVYLAADARRLGEHALELDFRMRALATGIVAGALALAGLLVVREDARPLWHGLTTGSGLAMIGVSAAAGVLTLGLVYGRRFGPARASAALAVAAIIAGWAVRAGAPPPARADDRCRPRPVARRSSRSWSPWPPASIVLIPALALLFGLFLRGRLGPAEPAPAPAGRTSQTHRRGGRCRRSPFSPSSPAPPDGAAGQRLGPHRGSPLPLRGSCGPRSRSPPR